MRRIVLAIALYGCVDSSGLANGKDDDAAVAPSDAGTEAAANDAGGTGGNLLTNGDFELGCAGWVAEHGFISEATTIHNGKASCRFCMDTTPDAFLGQTVTIAIAPGEAYVGDLYVKPAGTVADMTAAGYVGGGLHLGTPIEDPDPAVLAPLVDMKWQHATTIFSAAKPAGEIELQLVLHQSGNPAPQGNVICVFVDDAVLRRQ